MMDESTLSFLAWGPYPSTEHCRGQAVPRRFFASAPGEADANPGWMAKTLDWASFFATPFLIRDSMGASGNPDFWSETSFGRVQLCHSSASVA